METMPCRGLGTTPRDAPEQLRLWCPLRPSEPGMVYAQNTYWGGQVWAVARRPQDNMVSPVSPEAPGLSWHQRDGAVVLAPRGPHLSLLGPFPWICHQPSVHHPISPAPKGDPGLAWWPHPPLKPEPQLVPSPRHPPKHSGLQEKCSQSVCEREGNTYSQC